MMTLPFVQDRTANSSRFLSKDFAFVACQQSAGPLLKRHLIGNSSPFRLAFSRPGLLTFKVVSDCPSPDENGAVALPGHPMIRQTGWVLGQIRGTSANAMATEVKSLAGGGWDALHVFARDSAMPGDDGFEPGSSPLGEEIGQIVHTELGSEIPLNQQASAGARILDVVIAEPNHWLIAYHEATVQNVATGWPGGTYLHELPENAISRAYIKMAEAIAWSQLPLASGHRIVEIGSSPGGAAQRLLDMGLIVTGIDPAEMDPLLLDHPRFTHWRAKSSAVKRKLYRNFRWLVADANVAPNYTLDAVEDIVTYPTSRFEGLLLTLKLSTDQLVDQLDTYLARIGSWGFDRIAARQLSHNRREICVRAQKV